MLKKLSLLAVLLIMAMPSLAVAEEKTGQKTDVDCAGTTDTAAAKQDASTGGTTEPAAKEAGGADKQKKE
ncbi:hypothetical protein K2X30_03020 [bacterium]|jgi:hypothetical protein|nr:hypothetical protein [bacterium]